MYYTGFWGVALRKENERRAERAANNAPAATTVTAALATMAATANANANANANASRTAGAPPTPLN